MNKKKQKAMSNLETRWNNMSRIMQSLVSEFNMFKAAHENLLRQHYEDDTSNAESASLEVGE